MPRNLGQAAKGGQSSSLHSVNLFVILKSKRITELGLCPAKERRLETKVTTSEPFFRWRSDEYRFITEEAKARFMSGTNRIQGDVILWDLVKGLKALGVDAEPHLKVRSRYNPDMLRKPLKRYEEGGKRGDFDKARWKRAYQKVRRMFLTKGDKLVPLALEDVPFEGDKSAGAPTFLRKRDAYSLAVREAYAIRHGMTPPPLTIFHRGKNTEECRPVFGYPFSMTLIESRFFYPYQEALLDSPYAPYVSGKYDAQIGGLINEIRLISRWVLELDFSGLDGSSSAFLISKAFQIIHDCFSWDEFDSRDWDILVRYHMFAPVLAPDGRIYYGKDHGVSSGSMFTQIIDTIITMFGFCYAMEDYKYTRICALGDDSIAGVDDEPPDLKAIAKSCLELSLVVNVTKSHVKSTKEKPYFLGGTWERLIRVRPLEETVSKLCCPEKVRTEYFMKDTNPEAYKKALVERIEQYQEDNPDAFELLQKLKMWIKYPEVRGLPYILRPDDILFYKPVSEVIGRNRWRMLPHAANEAGRPPGAYRVIGAHY
jgi:hypothetical protein